MTNRPLFDPLYIVSFYINLAILPSTNSPSYAERNKSHTGQDLLPASRKCLDRPTINRQIIHSVYMEEILHLVLATNVLNAIGGTVKLGKDNIPSYPLEMKFQGKTFRDRQFDINLERFSPDAIDIFMQIEQPKGWDEPQMKARAAVEIPGYTIGEFYNSIKEKLDKLCAEVGEKAVFCGDPKALYPAIMNDMHGILGLAYQIVRIPIQDDPNGETGAPTFELVNLFETDQ